MKKIFGISWIILFIISGLINSCEEKPSPPSVTTTTLITDISYTTATSGGEATDEGGASILSKGICWNTSAEPTIMNSKTTETGGLGTFTSTLTQLSPNTLYYVRAYATNSAGTGYGNQVSFTTSQVEAPVLTTTEISGILQTSAVAGGNITDEKGGSVTARGVCWATATNPTTANSKTNDGNGTGSFESKITDLIPGTTYYVRAYATNSEGTGYGNELSFTTKERVVTSIEITNIPDSLVVSKKLILNTLVTYETGDPARNPQLVWSSSNPQSATVSSTGQVLGISRGSTKISASYNNYVKEIDIKVTSVEITTIGSYLSVPANNYIKKMPVIVVRFLPTNNGIDLDVSQSPDYWSLGEITLEKLINNIDVFDQRIKYNLEEGSRYRGYKDSQAVPYLGYEIIKYITVYEQIPASKYNIGVDNGTILYEPDFHAVFNRLGLSDIINSNGVKEVWLWMGEPAHPSWPSYNASIHGLISKHVALIESNMASPTTENVSNSHRIKGDMPILNHTYIVYCYNFRRTQAEAVHNHGHQLESILKHVNGLQDLNLTLFLQNFCGWGDNNYTKPPLGRAGDCHHPPNTTQDYDYLNATLVDSDIEDWKPNGGTKKAVNVDTWGKLTYNWPGAADFNQRVESQWYIYWMQNMPGYNNNIQNSTGKKITNWWIFTEDWDASIIAKKGLHD